MFTRKRHKNISAIYENFREFTKIPGIAISRFNSKET